jgi:hypothetical protein
MWRLSLCETGVGGQGRWRAGNPASPGLPVWLAAAAGLPAPGQKRVVTVSFQLSAFSLWSKGRPKSRKSLISRFISDNSGFYFGSRDQTYPEPFGGESKLSLAPALSPRRGRSLSSAGKNHCPVTFPGAVMAGSLSLGERVRVRASLTANRMVAGESLFKFVCNRHPSP